MVIERRVVEENEMLRANPQGNKISYPCSTWESRGKRGRVKSPIREIRNYDVLSAIKYLEPKTWRWQEVPKPLVMSDRQDTPHGKCQQHSDILILLGEKTGPLTVD